MIVVTSEHAISVEVEFSFDAFETGETTEAADTADTTDATTSKGIERSPAGVEEGPEDIPPVGEHHSLEAPAEGERLHRVVAAKRQHRTVLESQPEADGCMAAVVAVLAENRLPEGVHRSRWILAAVTTVDRW